VVPVNQVRPKISQRWQNSPPQSRIRAISESLARRGEAYQPPASSTFLSEQTSQQQPANNTFLSEQTSTSHQPPAIRTGCQKAEQSERQQILIDLMVAVIQLQAENKSKIAELSPPTINWGDHT
jgi:predicted transposase YdaD